MWDEPKVWRGAALSGIRRDSCLLTKRSSGRPRPLAFCTRSTVRHRLFLLLIFCALIFSASTFTQAQRASGMHSGPSMHSASANFRGLNGSHVFTGHARTALHRSNPNRLAYPGYGSLPFPFFDDNFDPSDIYSTGYPVSSEPPPFLMQALQGLMNPAANSMSSLMTPQPTQQNSSNEPLMLELQNGRYVRVNGPVINGDAEPINFSANSAAPKPHVKAAKPVPENPAPQTIAAVPLPAVVLVFRDGHSEQVRDYTIAQGSLYVRGDYYTDGYWNKKIDLATLNIPATLQTNATHNVTFVLPSAPNQVITRP
jgi:hypothetical protein